ncbi:MarR family winged helix-turn-helix transcriptional regulator [Shewanella intestini]|uniref:MarR family transcriptional regulator n=1 Tax=Shewanella intestini TaxID=2017544 RepID=A0ABS5HXV3_9GAMM|nr:MULTISPECIES: MarR family transcriptional regulator [Shewanella]MBR9726593.1 MarR family transcriptional regulator [Shewanella intestini]MRG34841.1 MarR family transcriptional regulator [Shewanella sp. XMDDZSB0408]
MEQQVPITITGIHNLDSNPMFLMGLVYKQFRSNVAAEMGQLNITLEMYGALRVLGEHGEITQQQLADYLLRNRSVTKRLVDNGIKLGLINASKSATNKKIKLLTLTDIGLQMATQCMPIVNDISQLFQDKLCVSETKQLKLLLSKLINVEHAVD